MSILKRLFKIKSKRYFIVSISYYTTNKSLINKHRYGMLLLETNYFPSKSELLYLAIKQFRECKYWTILNIYEFKSKEDYESFKGTNK